MKMKIAAVVALLAVGAFAEYATVDMVDLVRFHPNRERDRQLMRDSEKEYQDKLDAKRESFEQLKKSYEEAVGEARNPALGEKARAAAEEKALKRRESLITAERALQDDMRTYQRALQDLDNRMLRQVTGEIRKAVAAVAKIRKFKAVFDSTAVPYADEALDITDAVLTQLKVDPKVRHEAKAKEKSAESK